ncbi:hypothetical protein U9M48_013078, partial [Paspalum notatum var. saurae]
MDKLNHGIEEQTPEQPLIEEPEDPEPDPQLEEYPQAAPDFASEEANPSEKDDLIVCGQTTQQEVGAIKQIIDSFYSISGQTPNCKLTTLKADNLSHAGRLVYINSVLASIPIYYMTNILYPKNFLQKITSFLRNFWWKGNQSEAENTTICFRAWEDICQPKHLGGLGIKSISTVNKSLVTHSAWMIAAQREPFLSKVLKAKYHPHFSFWKAPSIGA